MRATFLTAADQYVGEGATFAPLGLRTRLLCRELVPEAAKRAHLERIHDSGRVFLA